MQKQTKEWKFYLKKKTLRRGLVINGIVSLADGVGGVECVSSISKEFEVFSIILIVFFPQFIYTKIYYLAEKSNVIFSLNYTVKSYFVHFSLSLIFYFLMEFEVNYLNILLKKYLLLKINKHTNEFLMLKFPFVYFHL